PIWGWVLMEPNIPSTCCRARSQVEGMFGSIRPQRVPCSMLEATNSASRRAARYFQSDAPVLPLARARGLNPARRVDREETRVLTPAWDRRNRSRSEPTAAGRRPGRRNDSSVSMADHTGDASSLRAIIPAAAPQEANVSALPRSRSNDWTRGKYMTALSLRKGQLRK